jgi:hypothetical protein
MDPFFNPEQGFNLIIYTYSAMYSTILREIEHVGANLSIFSLNNISKRATFQQRVEEFFASDSASDVLLVFADMNNDSKNRINMCRSIVTNQRMKRGLNLQPGEVLPKKHVCFIIRIDSTKED